MIAERSSKPAEDSRAGGEKGGKGDLGEVAGRGGEMNLPVVESS